ncbi:GntR family transcriptional regulator [Streptomyces cyslabdanicus]|uniref:GntR family transcriptional regulator n=1 Tax=Streptomyces cyslabdanicus TaxID=1470456 RepID=UPI004044CE42
MSPASVRVDTTSPVPPYEQIRAQLSGLIRTGGLTDGERLPPVRQLAADLGLATGTVARAYRELETAGLVRTRRGAGTRVCAPAPGPDTGNPLGPLVPLARDYVRAARQLGADDTRLLEALHQALREPPPGRSAR